MNRRNTPGGDRRDWLAPTAQAPVRARVVAPVPQVGLPADAAAAVTLAAAGLITGGTTLVGNWPRAASTECALQMFADMGGYVVDSAAGLTVTGRSTSGHLGSVDIDVGPAGTLAPLLLVVAARADGMSVLRGVEVDDRTETNLSRVGTRVRRRGDVVHVYGGQQTARVGVTHWSTGGEPAHGLAGLLMGLVLPDLLIEDWGTAADRLAGFGAEWLRMLSAEEYLVPGSALLPHDYLR